MMLKRCNTFYISQKSVLLFYKKLTNIIIQNSKRIKYYEVEDNNIDIPLCIN